MLEHDAHWQRRTNRLHAVPAAVPEEARHLLEAGNAVMLRDVKEATRHYILAAAYPGASLKEFLDNCVVQLLLAGSYQPCIDVCAATLRVAPTFLPAYLHRSRAHRGLLQWDAALRDLRSAASLGTPEAVMFGPDIMREAQLLTLEQRDREAEVLPLPDHGVVLGLSGACTLEDVKYAYRQLAKECHPDRWITAAPEVQAEAARRFQVVSAAYSTLTDDEERPVWLLRMALRTPPHRRLIIVGDVDSDDPLRSQRGASGRGPEASSGTTTVDWQRVGAVLQREQERRSRAEEERAQRSERRIAQDRRRLLRRKLEDDEAWQVKTNQPQKLPGSASLSLRQLTERALERWAAGDAAAARDLFQQAAEEGPDCKEALDNYAMALLAVRDEERCVAVCAAAVQLSPDFLPAYLHRARAWRGLQQWPLAQNDLHLALLLAGGGAAPDITREEQLLDSETLDRTHNAKPLEDYPQILNLGDAASLSSEVVTREFRRLAHQWHPDRWVAATEEERRGAAAHFHRVSEAYEVLSDAERRQEWQEAFALRNPPHRRTLLFPSTLTVLCTNAPRRSASYPNLVPRAVSGAATGRGEAAVQQQRDRREERARETEERERRRGLESVVQQLRRMIAADAQWQTKTTGEAKGLLELVYPKGVKDVARQGAQAMAQGDYIGASEAFGRAMEQSASHPIAFDELGDRCAAAQLLGGCYAGCVVTASRSLRHSPDRLPPLLLRARALRALRLRRHALGDLLTALTLTTQWSRDISREAQLLVLETDTRDRAHDAPDSALSDIAAELQREVPDLPTAPADSAVLECLESLVELWQPAKFPAKVEVQVQCLVQYGAALDLLMLLTTPGRRATLQAAFLHVTSSQATSTRFSSSVPLKRSASSKLPLTIIHPSGTA